MGRRWAARLRRGSNRDTGDRRERWRGKQEVRAVGRRSSREEKQREGRRNGIAPVTGKSPSSPPWASPSRLFTAFSLSLFDDGDNG